MASGWGVRDGMIVRRRSGGWVGGVVDFGVCTNLYASLHVVYIYVYMCMCFSYNVSICVRGPYGIFSPGRIVIWTLVHFNVSSAAAVAIATTLLGLVHQSFVFVRWFAQTGIT